jgi:hypothetical protein
MPIERLVSEYQLRKVGVLLYRWTASLYRIVGSVAQSHVVARFSKSISGI